MTQHQIDSIAASIVADERYIIEEAVAEVLSEPAKPDYSMLALMTLTGD